jgi:LmbE family N-acetylglucosaminyl deacetylase
LAVIVLFERGLRPVFCVSGDNFIGSIPMSETYSRLLVVSPHLDDAVFSCGAVLAANRGAVVCTIFSGCPEQQVSTDWDSHCGFTDARSAMRARLGEDGRALAILASIPERAGFLDAQYVPYGTEATRHAIAQSLDSIIRQHAPQTLLMPFGLYHSDHELVHLACCDAWLEHPSLLCLAYEDVLYRRIGGHLQARLADLHARGITSTPSPGHWRESERHQEKKRAAVKEYASQLAAFGPHGYDDVFCTERCWKLEFAQ